MFEDHPDHQYGEFELHRRYAEERAVDCGCEVGFLDRQSAVLRGVVADDELVLDVHVNEAPRLVIEAVVVQY
jgi:hypothetical protein